MITSKDYRPVALSDRDLFQEHYEKYPHCHSEYTFTSLISWAEYVPVYYLFREDNLLLLSMKDGKLQFRPPIGNKNEDLLAEVLEAAKREGGDKPFIAVCDAYKEWISSLYPDMTIVPDRDFFDYVYLASDLSDLPGKNYLRQRNHLNKFRKTYDYVVEPIDSVNKEEVDEFLKRWCLWHGCEHAAMLEAERKAILYCMEHYFDLSLSGILIRVGGEIQALSVYEEMNKETAVIHFEKAITDYEGVYPAINNEAAKILAKNYEYINRESDLGIQGLRTAKERLHPHHMEKIHYIEKEKI